MAHFNRIEADLTNATLPKFPTPCTGCKSSLAGFTWRGDCPKCGSQMCNVCRAPGLNKCFRCLARSVLDQQDTKDPAPDINARRAWQKMTPAQRYAFFSWIDKRGGRGVVPHNDDERGGCVTLYGVKIAGDYND